MRKPYPVVISYNPSRIDASPTPAHSACAPLSEDILLADSLISHKIVHVRTGHKEEHLSSLTMDSETLPNENYQLPDGHVRRRRHSCVHEDLDDDREAKIVLLVEWLGLLTIVGTWIYLQVVFFTTTTDTFKIVGIPFHIGPNFGQYFFQQIILVNCFATANTVMMLLARHSRLAYAIVGFQGVHHNTCFPLLVSKAILFTTIVTTSTGLSDFFPRGILSIFSTVLHSTLSFYFTSQFIYTTLYPKLG